ncbi:polysaccharide deacetylase family protein [Dyadobacter sp. 3J3]|uniref:polysaccharide deacetylase family protein n=1 Tax=Dyadobacter sp. 3J3 TaxID=2606600 RepID=UPI001359B583|nr:polysaccharide deacetylase family protein [Dyadobacter sp. 3J3]
MSKSFVMLTFDLEEFDIAEEYGQKVSHSDQMTVTKTGTERLISLLDKQGICATFFTTGNYAQLNPELIKSISLKHEIASHALYHSPFHEFRETDILESKNILESITGEKVTGFRMPRLKPFDHKVLAGWGFVYDSSINPTYLPGRYNLLHKSPLPYRENGLLELPCSTTPTFRFPLFWLAFKNLPISLYAALCQRTLRKRKNLMLYFHPWEFAEIGDYKMPGYVKSPDGQELVDKLDKLIQNLKKQNAAFVTCQEFCEILEKADEPIKSV